MITATTVLILWGQWKKHLSKFSWIELLRIIVLPVTLVFLILRLSITECHMISNEFSINFRLIVLFVYKTLFMCCNTRDILILWHRRTNCKSCSLRPELLGASSPPHRGQPLYGTRGPVRRHEDKVVYWSRITVLSLSLLSTSHRSPWPLIRNTWIPHRVTICGYNTRTLYYTSCEYISYVINFLVRFWQLHFLDIILH